MIFHLFDEEYPYDGDDVQEYPWAALYWRYYSPQSEQFEVASEAVNFLVYGEENRNLSSAAVVNVVTGRIACQFQEPEREAYYKNGPWSAQKDADKFDAIDTTLSDVKRLLPRS